MSYGELFKAFDKSTKEMAISLALIFPMVYIDCWKLNDNFKDLDIVPQMMLCGGVSVIVLLAGVAVSIFCFGVFVSWKRTKFVFSLVDKMMINSYSILAPIGFSTGSVLAGMVETINSFEGVYLGFSFLLIGGLMGLQFLNKRPESAEVDLEEPNKTEEDEIQPKKDAIHN